MCVMLFSSGKKAEAEVSGGQSVLTRIDPNKLQGALANASVLGSLEVSMITISLYIANWVVTGRLNTPT